MSQHRVKKELDESILHGHIKDDLWNIRKSCLDHE